VTCERLLLRRYEVGDAPGLFAAARESIAEVHPYLAWCHPGYSLDDSRDWIRRVHEMWRRGEAFDFAVFDRSDGRYAGGCGLNFLRPEDGTANLGYWIRSSATGRGFATQATRALAAWGFRHLGLQRVEILMAVHNAASRRVAEKAGATFEGTLRDRLRLHGAATAAHLFSLVPRDL
jgi:RimJ/RimL family protein N-acetyltransferase